MTSHERFARMFAHQPADRIPIIDGSWADTVALKREFGDRLRLHGGINAM